ncbi:hypothetical protein AB0E69_17690 [Kribbella sp. NPDC026611]|uniref:hypothetical protein n=1 Tax=Kribbella sp. NPDC026611 TaxID=3154911 RepID=UPI0034094F3E
MTSSVVLRPSPTAAGRSYLLLLALYAVLVAVLCVSLGFWAISWPVAGGLLVVLLAAVFLVFRLIVRSTTLAVDADAITYRATPWGQPRVLQRSQVVRVVLVDRVSRIASGFLVILDADGNRISAPRAFWPLETLHQAVDLIGLPAEHREVLTPRQLLTEFGVDPAVRRNPARTILTQVLSAAVGVLIAWPILRAAFHSFR